MLFILIKQDLSQCVTCQEKHITVKKEPHESLGMTVAGGRGSKSGELPIFVTSVQPHGCLARDGRIKRGGVWLPWAMAASGCFLITMFSGIRWCQKLFSQM